MLITSSKFYYFFFLYIKHTHTPSLSLSHHLCILDGKWLIVFCTSCEIAILMINDPFCRWFVYIRSSINSKNLWKNNNQSQLIALAYSLRFESFYIFFSSSFTRLTKFEMKIILARKKSKKIKSKQKRNENEEAERIRNI